MKLKIVFRVLVQFMEHMKVNNDFLINVYTLCGWVSQVKVLMLHLLYCWMYGEFFYSFSNDSIYFAEVNSDRPNWRRMIGRFPSCLIQTMSERKICISYTISSFFYRWFYKFINFIELKWKWGEYGTKMNVHRNSEYLSH